MQDYAKLAAELGGKPAGPDYAALAREAGGETRESDKPKSSAKAPSLVDTALMDIPAMPAAIRGGLAILRGVKQNPVAAGALAGGLATAPMTGGASIPASMAFAGLGAAGGAGLGSAAEQLGTGRPKDASTVLTEMVREGSAQATGQGVGAVVAKTAGVVAPKILKGILRPTRRLQDEFGDVVGVGLRERIPVGGSNVAADRMRESASRARGMVKAAEDAGAPPIKSKELHGEFRKVGETLQKRRDIGMPDESAELTTRAKLIHRANPNGIPLTRAQDIKGEAQEMASRTFRAIEQGNPVRDTTALTDKAVATGLRKAIEQRVPGVADVNRRTQELMGLQEALEAAEARSGGITGWNPLNVIGGIMPSMGSRAAFLVDAVSKAPLPSGGQNLAALLSMLASSRDDK
jgi:hypothetical protein